MGRRARVVVVELFHEEVGATLTECILLAVLVAISAITGWLVLLSPALSRER